MQNPKALDGIAQNKEDLKGSEGNGESAQSSRLEDVSPEDYPFEKEIIVKAMWIE